VAGALASLALMMHDAGRAPDAEALVGEAVVLAEPLGPSGELARAYAGSAHLGMAFDDLERTIDWGQRAIELAESLDETEILVHALTSVGTMLLKADRSDGRERLERALQLALEAGLDGAVGRAFNNLVNASVWSRNYDVAERYVEPGIEFALEHGLDLWVQVLRGTRLALDLDRGRWRQAAGAAAELLADPTCMAGARVEALVTIGRVRGRYGDPDARGPLEEALVLADSIGEPQLIYPTALARAEVAWLDGDPEGVDEATSDVLALALEHANSWSAGGLACWRWRAGLADELAAELLAEPYRLSIAGQWRSATERWRELGCPYEEALAFADADDEAALRRALDELNGLGARPAAAIVARRLRERGVRGVPRGPRSATRENPVGLTGRELDVLALLSQGMRNAEIAERLVVSHKTVDHHVSAILRKLDVHTRGEAAAEAVRLGLNVAG
jgi:DNA-binding CsgD family transcriptional regulator